MLLEKGIFQNPDGIPGEPCGDSGSSRELQGWLPLPGKLASALAVPFIVSLWLDGEQLPLFLIPPLASSAGAGVGVEEGSGCLSSRECWEGRAW